MEAEHRRGRLPAALLAVMTVLGGGTIWAQESPTSPVSTNPIGTPVAPRTGPAAGTDRGMQVAAAARRPQEPGAQPTAPRPPQQPNETDLTIPRAEREGEATEVEAAAEAAAPDETKLLMKWLDIEDSQVKFYGWIQNSFTGNTNGRPKNDLNFGVNPNFLANTWMGNQYYLIVEKTLEQNDQVNFGFRVDNLFGNDWQFNHMAGLFDGSFKLNRFAGYDPAQMYAEVHLPILTEGGMDIKGGRMYSLAGYEVVPATGRPLLSVPYMFNYGQPFTHFGAMSVLHLTDQINIHNCIINGWDRWIDQRYKWGYMGGINWTSKDTNTNLAFIGIWGPNQFPNFLHANTQIFPTGYINIPTLAKAANPGYGRNDRILFTTVLTHKWNEKFTQVIESDQGSERSVPGLGTKPFGLNYTPASDEWYSFGNWFLYQFTDKITGVWRSEWFRDVAGARTGFRGNFYEMTLGAIYKPKPYLWLRPEARYDWAQTAKPYNDATRGSQFTLAFDIILLY